MKNHISALLVIAVMAATVALPSCNFSLKVGSGDNDSIGDSIASTDTLWNDSVQTVFFDTHFGATAQEVVDNFSQHGLMLLENLSDDDALVFGHNSEYYTFGGMQWVNLTVNLNNGKFYNISFYNPRDTKEEAIADFKNVVANVEKKYKLMDFDPQDSTIYLFKRAYTKSHYIAGVVCYSYSDESNKTCYTTSLDYTDTDLQNQPPADL